jgi:hypothetical protein
MAKFKFDFRFVEAGYERMIIEQYVALVEAHLPTIENEERARIWANVDHSDELERDIAHRLEDLIDDGVSTRFLLGASIVACWALYEATVLEIASYVQSKRGLALRVSSLRGNFLERARTYFDDVLKFPLHQPTTDWKRLEKLANLRHFLAHANGDLRSINPSLRSEFLSWANGVDGLSIVNDQYLVIRAPFAKETLLFLKSLLDELVDRTRASFE